MPDRKASLDQDYFEALYAGSPDPWDFRTSPYEQRKYAATLAILPERRYARALEVGCSIGIFTRLLAERCDALLAVDTSSHALADAARETAGLAGLAFRRATLPAEFPDGTFDLVVLSEVLYYLSEDDLADVAARCRAAVADPGTIVLCHWLGKTNYPLGGDEAADAFTAAMAPQFEIAASRREPEYRLDLLTRVDRVV